MTEDEIQKLLGGYATDALSVEERKRLFEAALHDQKLFDRLQNEDALRELLQDPVVRAQARQALEGASQKQRFSLRRWAVGVAVPAAVAVLVVAVMKRPNAPPEESPERAPAAVAELKKAEPETRSGVRQSAEAVQGTTSPTKPATRPKLSAALQAGSGQATVPLETPAAASPSFRTLATPAITPAVPARIPDDVRRQFSPQVAASGSLYSGPLVQLTVQRTNGEMTGIEATVGITSYVALYRLDAGGNAQHVYPQNDVAAPVQAGGTIQVPGAAIQATGGDEKLRLVVVPTAQPAAQGTVGGVASADSMKNSIFPAAPVVVDVPLPAR